MFGFGKGKPAAPGVPDERVKPGDLAVIALVLMLAGGIWAAYGRSTAGAASAIVTQDGRTLAEIRLTGLEQEVRVPFEGSVHGVVVANNGAIWFESSTCPDQTCVHAGSVSAPGKAVACLPARVLVRIVSDGEGSVVENGTDSGVDVILH